MIGIPPFSLEPWQNNLNTTLATANLGTQITGGSSHTKGSYRDLIASADFETYAISLALAETSAAATRTDALVDIAIGSGGNEKIILPDLLAGWAGGPVGGTASAPRVLWLPMHIAKGQTIRARCQGVQASKTVEVAIWLHGGPSLPPWATFKRADAIGVNNSGASVGTSITPGNSSAFGSWTSVGGTTGRPYNGLLFLAQGTLSDTTQTGAALLFDVGFNSASLGRFFFGTSTSEVEVGPIPPFPIFKHIPQGTQLQVRAASSLGTAEAVDVALYGLY